MNKTLSDGTVIEKARFIRTTCKYCGKELSKGSIFGGYSWCDKKHKIAYIRRCNRKNGLNEKQRERLHEKQMMRFGSSFSNETDCQNSGRVQ